jgi:poly(3-hydroxybutyrate) depolymerase
MLYHAYELTHAALAPLKAFCRLSQALTDGGLNPWAATPAGRVADAACRWFDGVTHRYGRPEWNVGDGAPEVVAETAFCDLARFVTPGRDKRPKALLVAPLSGHYPTLVRGTAQALAPDFDLYVTDWRDGRMVPAALGEFGLADFVDTVIGFLRHLGPGTHVIAVCQPAVPVLAASALMARLKDAACPRSMVLMGGPIDARVNPTAANELARSHDIGWFERTVISHVPPPHPGAMRRVYPGFVQLSGFLAKNLERHIDAQITYFEHLVAGDGDSAAQHRAFYKEFLAVMDLPAQFFLETVESVFQRFDLAKGAMEHAGLAVEPQAITKTPLFAIEGGGDNICPPGQTARALDLCSGLPARMKRHYLHPSVGHYGVFNGRRFRADIAPRVKAFIEAAAKA